MPTKFENPIFVEIFGCSNAESSVEGLEASKSTAPLPFEDPNFKFTDPSPEVARKTQAVLDQGLADQLLGEVLLDNGTLKKFEIGKMTTQVRESSRPDDLFKNFDFYSAGNFDARLDHLLDNLKKGVKQRCPCDCVACGDDRCAECCADRKCETCTMLNSTYPERKAAKSAESLPMSKRFSENFEDYLWSDNPHINDLKEAFKTSDPDEARALWKKWQEEAA